VQPPEFQLVLIILAVSVYGLLVRFEIDEDESLLFGEL
jgi:hypothetical protein